MIDTLVTGAAEAILKKAFSLAANEFAIAWGFKESLTSLHDKLEIIRAMIRDAERQKGNSTEGVMAWLTQLKDVVSEADDLLDEVEYEMLRRKVKKRDHTTRKIQCLPNLKKFSFRREMGHKIENINAKLSDVNKRAELLKLQKELQGSDPKSPPKQTYSLGKFNIVGREKDELHIVKLLTESKEEKKPTIVPLVGMGGIGKTALAKSV
ncbi:CC-NBS-LRR resistance protein, partial [Tanacetum coccineum]